MMQIIHCIECGGTSISLDSVSVDVVFSKHHHCDKCYHGREEKQTYFFCSEECFHKYLLRVAEGKAKFKFKLYDQLTGQSTDPLPPI